MFSRITRRKSAVLADVPVDLQFGALCWRRVAAKIEVLLITSSEGNWILPKGRPIKGTDGAGAAAQEAWEEAGIKGDIGPCLGVAETTVLREDGQSAQRQIEIYGLHATKVAKKFPEADRRIRRWLSLEEAREEITSPGLKAFLCNIDPERLEG